VVRSGKFIDKIDEVGVPRDRERADGNPFTSAMACLIERLVRETGVKSVGCSNLVRDLQFVVSASIKWYFPTDGLNQQNTRHPIQFNR
jgi:hypothetical protein